MHTKDGVAIEHSNDALFTAAIFGIFTPLKKEAIKFLVKEEIAPDFKFIDRNSPNQSTIENDKNGNMPNITGIYLTNKDKHGLDKIDGKEPAHPQNDNDAVEGKKLGRHTSGSVK